MPQGVPWPRISIVAASLNQGRFVEKMIRSFLLQGYPDLELIVIDGGITRVPGFSEIQSRVASIPVKRQKIHDGTALGIAKLVLEK